MPIPQAQIPVLIKQAEERKVQDWKKDYFKKEARRLQVHTKGQLFTKVDTLFPNEHPDSKAHCLATYEPITKSSIWKGINNLKRIFSHSSVTYTVGDELGDWLATYEHDGQNLLNYFLEAWVSKAVAEDPNGVFVVYPPEYAAEHNMCPVQFVRSELIQSMDPEYFAFVSEEQSDVEYSYEVIATKREIFEDITIGQLNARTFTETTYNNRLDLKIKKAVVHIFTKDGLLIYTRAKGNQFDWTLVDFAQPLRTLPVFIGGGEVADEADQLLFESFVAPFIPFGNLALLQHRNHRAVDLQFSYPRMSELQMPCDYQGCVDGRVPCAKTDAYPLGLMPCPNHCSHGWITVQSPYKVYTPRFDPMDENKNEHLKIDPVKFYSPDSGIIQYSKDAWRDYLKMAEEAIHVQQRVYTGQVESAESKEKNFEALYTWLGGPARTYYNNVRAMLQALEEYISPSPVTVTVEKPYSFAILTEEEAFTALTAILGSNAPIFIKADRVESFLAKFVSKDSPVLRAMRILKQVDLLLFYSHAEVQGFKAQNAITQEQITRHVLAYPLMVRMYQRDPSIYETNSDEQLVTLLEQELKAKAPPAAESDFRRQLTEQLNLGGGGTA